MKTLPELSYFPHLETLDVHDCESLTGVSSGVPLVALKNLHLYGCISLEALPDLV